MAPCDRLLCFAVWPGLSWGLGYAWPLPPAVLGGLGSALLAPFALGTGSSHHSPPPLRT